MDNKAYIISQTTETGDTGIIKAEYFPQEEYKITVVKNNQVIDSFTIVGVASAMAKVMMYQNKLFNKTIVPAKEMLIEFQALSK